MEEADMKTTEDFVEAEIGEQLDNRSSSLSDPEDDNHQVEKRSGEGIDMVDDQPPASQRSLEVDSEAETERLDQTPQKPRKHADSLGRTPSKLSQTATADEDLSEPPSPIPADVGAASSTSTVATAGE